MEKLEKYIIFSLDCNILSSLRFNRLVGCLMCYVGIFCLDYNETKLTDYNETKLTKELLCLTNKAYIFIKLGMELQVNDKF